MLAQDPFLDLFLYSLENLLLYNKIGDVMAILLGILPGIFFFLFFFFMDQNKNYKKYLFVILLILVCAVGSYFCYRLEMHFGSYFKKVAVSNYFEILFYAIFGVAIFEEGYKWFFTFLFSLFDKNKKTFDMIYYSVFASCGFATFENVYFYALVYGNGVIRRMFTAFPSHILNALWMGYFFERYQFEKGRKRYFYLILSLIIPILFHALYNSFLYGNRYSEYFYYFYISYIIVSIGFYLFMRKRFIK